MRRSARAAQAAVLALLAGLTLASCGDTDTKTPADGTGSSAQGQAARSALSQGTFADKVFGAIEDAGSAQIHFESGTGGKKFIGEGEVQYGDELAVRMTMPNPMGGGGKQEMLLVGDTMYMGVGDKYLSMSLDALRSSGMPDMSANLDPKTQKKAFEAAITGFRQSGNPETLDGVKAIPYEITLDPAKAPETFGTVTSEPLTFIYYVGPDNLPRKMTYTDKNGEFVVTYTDWGDPVDIEAPPADKLTQGIG